MSEPALSRARPTSGAQTLRFPGDSLEKQLADLRAGQVSSVELTKLAVQRALTSQVELRAFRVIYEEQALAEATRADARRLAGEHRALLGVPVAVGEEVRLSGETGDAACDPPPRHPAPDSELVRQLRHAGAVIIGKTASGAGRKRSDAAPSPSRNPWDLHSAVNAGAAAAVAAGIVAASVADDRGARLRVAAACCGVVGLRPHRGRIVNGRCEGDDRPHRPGLVATSAADAAFLLDLLDDPANAPEGRSRSFSRQSADAPSGLSVGLCLSPPRRARVALDPGMAATVERVAERLQDLGHAVEEAPLALPWSRSLSSARGSRPMCAQVGRLRRNRAPRPLPRLERCFERFEVFLTPTICQHPKPTRLGGRPASRKTGMTSVPAPHALAWQATEWPALTMPVDFADGERPSAVQLLGRGHSEGLLLALARQLELVGDSGTG
jgi:amidase